MEELCFHLKSSVTEVDPAKRLASEQYINSVSQSPNYVQAVFSIVSYKEVSDDIRLAAVISLKNIFAYHYYVDPSIADNWLLNQADADYARANIVELYFACDDLFLPHILLTVKFICLVDFHENYPDFIPKIVNNVFITDSQTCFRFDRHSLRGLRLLHFVFEYYRYESRSDPLWVELAYVLGLLAEPLSCAVANFDLNQIAALDENSVYSVLQHFCLCVKLFHDLIFQEMSDHFLNFLHPVWLVFFKNIISLTLPNTNKCYLVLLKCKRYIIDCLALILFNYQEDLDDQTVSHFLSLVYSVLNNFDSKMVTTEYDNYDELSKNCYKLTNSLIELFSTVIDSSSYKQFISDEQTISMLVTDLIVPFVDISKPDLILFEEDSIDFAVRDLEMIAPDGITIRHSLQQFIRKTAYIYSNLMVKIFSNIINGLLQQSVDPNNNFKVVNYSDFEKSIFLLVIIAGKNFSTHSLFVSDDNGYFDMNNFASVFINILKCNSELPEFSEIQNRLVVTAIFKFFHTFKNHVNISYIVELFQISLNVLCQNSHYNNVIFWSYMSLFLSDVIEICIKPPKNTISLDGVNKLTELFKSKSDDLFVLIKHLVVVCADQPSAYIAKAISDVAVFLSGNNKMGEYNGMISNLLTNFIKTLNEYIFVQSSSNDGKSFTVLTSSATSTKDYDPSFVHGLFETIAVLYKGLADDNDKKVQSEFLLNIVGSIFSSKKLHQLNCYAYQIYALILLLRPKESFPKQYAEYYQQFLEYKIWQNKSDVPSLINIMIGYMVQLPGFFIAENEINKMVMIFDFLANSPVHDGKSFQLAIALIRNVPWNNIQNKVGRMLQLAFGRLDSRSNDRFRHEFLKFCYVLVCDNENNGGGLGCYGFFDLLTKVEADMGAKKISLKEKFLQCLSVEMQTPTTDQAYKNAMVYMSASFLKELFEMFFEGSEFGASFFVQFSRTVTKNHSMKTLEQAGIQVRGVEEEAAPLDEEHCYNTLAVVNRLMARYTLIKDPFASMDKLKHFGALTAETVARVRAANVLGPEQSQELSRLESWIN